MTEPQLSHYCDFIIRYVVMSSKMLLQYGKEMKIERCDIRTIKRMIKDSKTKVLNLCTYSHTCVVECCHVKGAATPCEEIL